MFKKFLLITGLAIMLFSCSVFKPMQHDDGAISQLSTIQSDVNVIYSHPDFKQSEYTLVDNEIAGLITWDSLRANVNAITNNVKELQKLVSGIEDRHRAKGTLNATLQSLYKQEITDKITDIFTAENKLK